MQKAVIYTRVSSKAQAENGHGLEGQETICKEYARRNKYDVMRVFYDEGISGGLTERPAMKELFKYLEEANEEMIVIFDDIKRFARDVIGHFQLKNEIYSRGGRIESPNHKFEDSPEGKFIETIMAGSAELERNQNREQVKRRQRARLLNGYWTFCQPTGLKYIKDPGHGKILVSDEPIGSIIQSVLNKYANNELLTKVDVKKYIDNEYSKYGLNRSISNNGVDRLLKNPLYAGYIEYEPWGIEFAKGQHEGLIGFETYQIIQRKLEDKSIPNNRKDLNKDFPLRRHVICSGCGNYLTASWNKGRNKYYANYVCNKAGCIYRYKTISKKVIEPAFIEVLKKVKPKKSTITIAKGVLEDAWDNRLTNFQKTENQRNNKIKEYEAKISKLMSRISNTENQSMIARYEKEVIHFESQIKKISKTNISKHEHIKFGTALNYVMNYIENPIEIWRSDDLSEKTNVMNIYFREGIEYDLKSGFGTAEISDPAKTITSFTGKKNHLVEMAGIEPASKKSIEIQCTSVGGLFQTTVDKDPQKPKVDRLPKSLIKVANEYNNLHPD